ncbi:IS3 family transposase [Pseudomonas aeruginosa]
MANRRLSKEIRTIHHEVNGIYGHRRIKAELAAMGKVALESIRLDLTRSLEDK